MSGRAKAKGSSAKVCACGNSFFPTYPANNFCQACLDDIEHDANVEMFGDDVEQFGLENVGNK